MRVMLTTAEVAARLGVTPTTVRRNLEGRKVGRRIYYPEAEIRKLTGETAPLSMPEKPSHAV